MNEYGNINIFGEGFINGGKYNNIKIFGQSIANENIECNSLVVMGESSFKENLKVYSFKIIGEANINGRLNCERLKVMGACKLIGDAEISSLKIMGEVEALKDLKVNVNLKVMGEGNFEKNLTFNELEVQGELKVNEDCEGNRFYNSGEVRINGLLSADKIEIVPKKISKIEEIGGSEIIIKKTKWYEFTNGKVISKLIEGDNIILENTICNIVRGHDINILSGCSIDKIEYTGKLTIDKNSKVGEQICLKN